MTLTAMENLAQTLYALEDLAGAQHLEEQILEVRYRVLGEDHPDTLVSKRNLALALKAEGDLPYLGVLIDVGCGTYNIFNP